MQLKVAGDEVGQSCFLGRMADVVHDESGKCIISQGLRVTSDSSKEPPIWSGDDPAVDFGHLCDGEFYALHTDCLHLDFNIAFIGESGDSILGVLAEWAAVDYAVVGYPVNDQPAGGHGHSRDCIEDAIAYPTLEIQASVLVPTK